MPVERKFDPGEGISSKGEHYEKGTFFQSKNPPRISEERTSLKKGKKATEAPRSGGRLLVCKDRVAPEKTAGLSLSPKKGGERGQNPARPKDLWRRVPERT